MFSWWRKDLVSPGGAGQMDAVWMAECDSDYTDGRTVERRPGVEGRAGAEIVGNKAEGEIGRRPWEVWSMRPGNL